ncbi:hypothetical protein GC176_03835 [bacterium]|nr:hypothetical protein [bacterium]
MGAALLVTAAIFVFAGGNGGQEIDPARPQIASPAGLDIGAGSVLEKGIGTVDGTADISDEEIAQLGRDFAASISSENSSATVALMDFDGLSDLITRGLGMSASDRAGFKAGFRQAFLQPVSFVGQMVAQIHAGGSIRFQRVLTVDGERRALIRLLQSDGAVSYNELIPVRRSDGRIRVLDVYSYLTAERISETGRRGVIPAVAAKNRSLLERLTGTDRAAAEYFRRVNELVLARQRGNHRGILRLSQALPTELKTDKMLLLLRLQAAQALRDDPEYVRAMEAFRSAHPNDPALDFVLIDYYALKEDKPQLLQCLERLYKRTEQDAYLGSLLAETVLETDDLDRAASVVTAAIESEPDLQNAQIVLFRVQAERRDFDGCLKTLTAAFRQHGFYFGNNAQVRALGPGVAAFMDSPQGERYRRVAKGG